MNGRWIQPVNGCPVNVYHQSIDDGCLFCGLASALAYFGDRQKAEFIFSLWKMESTDSNWNIAVRGMQAKPDRYVCVKYEENISERTLKKYPHIKECVLCTVLVGADKSVNHSVSICQGFVFDTNSQHALKKNKENLDWCCSAPGSPSTFMKFHRALYFYPLMIKKEFRLRINHEKMTLPPKHNNL